MNGTENITDSALGSPSLDLPMLICHHIWLLKTYDYMRRLGLKNYLMDRRFTAEKCSFELYGYPPNYKSAVVRNQGTMCPSYCSQAGYANLYPCNTAACDSSTQSTNCPTYCLQPVYANDQTCLQCHGNSTSHAQCSDQNMRFCSNPANTNHSPCNTYPCKILNHTLDLGFCGSTTEACNFTVFVPNSSAIEYFSVSTNGQRVMRDQPRFQWLFKRLILPGHLYIEEIINGNHQMKMLNGELVTLTKHNDRDVEIHFHGAKARMIHTDEEATNGVVHIIDQVLFVNEDLTRIIT